MLELSFYTKKNKFRWHLYYIGQEPTKGTFSFFLSFGKYSLNGTFSVFLQKDTFNQDGTFSIFFNHAGHLTVNRMDIQKIYHRWVNCYFMRKETAIIFDSARKTLP